MWAAPFAMRIELPHRFFRIFDFSCGLRHKLFVHSDKLSILDTLSLPCVYSSFHDPC